MKRTPGKDPPARALVRVGQVLAGKYRVERVIGRGGMGLVVAARHLHLGERVAVKLLLPGAPLRGDAFERFLREGRAAARMRGEHVARVHDAGVLETGEPYLVLEYLEGVDLRTLLRKRGRLPVDTAVVYTLQVCEALAEAHALGVVHRDLKPGNLFLTRRADGSEVVKVIDFGISKIMSPPVDGGEETTLTEGEGAIGTPGYMPPEQMRSARAADARADIWSLGAVLYGLLTGSAPFTGETMVAVYDAILKGAPALRAARPEVPPELEEVVLRCLRIDPEERYPDVGQLAAALAELAPPAARLHAERAERIARGRPAAEALAREDVAGVASLSRGPGLDAPSGEGASIEVSFDSGRATTEITREPSWVRSPPSRADAEPPARRGAPDHRTAMLFSFGLALATGGAAAWWARRGASEDPSRSSSIASPSADRREAAPSAWPPAAPPPAVSPGPVPPAPARSVAPAPPALPRRSPEATPRRLVAPAPARGVAAASPSVPASPSAPRVPGLAETPD